ncbi:TonB-dependent receptor [Pseudomonas citronellolis]|uniref:TonB-dependent receptor n=1 Tax=Pseudomonas citronellolis TaxID=53408 RepID=UPI000718A504|nr:TonB-dependent receptor [Pseudomonas citronellolis]KRV79427.1 TonB-dependent receptor [Pseudomonas citronellolis]KRW76630.1 TonB-dependent receptor [Pseudomonas citronellolis]
MFAANQSRNIHPLFKVSALALAIATAPSAWAEDAAAEAGESITVYGQADSLDKALQQQRRSDSVESVVHADSIGQLPDSNAAEALQRVPGTSIERDQGEGRFVRVRGLGPDLNAVTINGTLVPSPEAGRRAVALDVLPSELIQSLSVIKTLTPDMDANSLGGTIEVESLSAFDHDGLFYTGTAQSSYDENTHRFSPKYSGAASQRFSLGEGIDNFGVAAALSWQKRKFGSDNVETGGDWDFDDGARLSGMEQRDYRIERERSGGALNFDYRPDDDSKYWLRSLYSRFKDNETRQSTKLSFEDALAEGETGETSVERRLKQREETQTIQSYVFGGEQRRGDWTFSGQLGWSKSDEDSPGHMDPVVYDGGTLDGGWYDSEKPRQALDPAFYEPSGYSLKSVKWGESYTSDKEHNIRLDLARDYGLAGNPATFKFGGKLSRRTKDNDEDIWNYKKLDKAGLTDEQLSLANALDGKVHYSLQPFGQGISGSTVEGLLSGLDRSQYYDEEASTINDFRMHEDIDAGYFMNTVDVGDWRFIAGLRYEGTHFEAKGSGVDDGEFQGIERKRDYHNWLPGLHVRYQLDDDTQIRAAWTNAVVRPTFEQLAPGFAIDGDEAEFGNPDLAALRSHNLDLAIERYLGRASVVSASLFYKDIRNFVYNTDLAGSGQWADFDEALSFANGDKAKVYGLELAWSQKMVMLPAPWDGLLLGANATFSHSRAKIADAQGNSRNVSLPSQSDVTGNFMVGYEKDRLSLRLSANYKSDYLYEIGDVGDKRYDSRVDDQTQFDFSARYSLTDNLQVFLNAENLTDEPYYVYTGHRKYNYQYEEYGRTFTLGLTLTHF